MNTLKKLLVIAFLLCSVIGWAGGSTTVDLGVSAYAKPFVFAYANNTNTYPSGSTVAASFSNEIYDPTNSYDGVATFTVPTSGVYKFTLSLVPNASADTKNNTVTMVVNGAIKRYWIGHMSSTQSLGITAIFSESLSAGVAVSFCLIQDTGSSSTLNSTNSYQYNSLTIERTYPN